MIFTELSVSRLQEEIMEMTDFVMPVFSSAGRNRRGTRILAIGTALCLMLSAVPAVPVRAASSPGRWKYKVMRTAGKKKRVRYSYRYRNGDVPSGAVRINGTFWYFTGDSGKLRRGRSGRVDADDGSYYVLSSGRCLTGWQVLDSHLYYFSPKTAKMVQGKTVQKILLHDDGHARMTLDAAVRYKSLKLLNRISSPVESRSSRLRRAFLCLTSKKHFSYALVYPDLKSDRSWIKKYANQMLSTRAGNCYGFACTFAALADTLGFHAQVVTTRIHGSRDHAGDGFTRHAICRINGLYYDPELDWAGSVNGIYARSRYPLAHKSMTYWDFSDSDGTISGRSFISGRRSSPRRQLVHAGGKYYYFDRNGKKLTGLYCVKKHLYLFRSSGTMTDAEFQALKEASAEGSPWEELEKLIGKPAKKKDMGDSCYGEQGGRDWNYIYRNVIICIFRGADGSEIVESFSAR